MFTQLRDVLAAEDSTIVAQKHHHSRMFLPNGTESNLVATSVRELNFGKPGAIGLWHRSSSSQRRFLHVSSVFAYADICVALLAQDLERIGVLSDACSELLK